MNKLLLSKCNLRSLTALRLGNTLNFKFSTQENQEPKKKFPDFMDTKSKNKTKENLIWKRTQAYKNLKLKRLFDEKDKGQQTFEQRDREDWINFTRKIFGRQYMSLHDKWQIKVFRTKRLKENNKKNFQNYVSYVLFIISLNLKNKKKLSMFIIHKKKLPFLL